MSIMPCSTLASAGANATASDAAQRGRPEDQHGIETHAPALFGNGKGGHHARRESLVGETIGGVAAKDAVELVGGVHVGSFMARRALSLAFARITCVFTVPSGIPSAAEASSWDRSA